LNFLRQSQSALVVAILQFVRLNYAQLHVIQVILEIPFGVSPENFFV